MCKSIFCVQECPFFEKSERSFYLEMTDSDQNEVKKFIDKMSDDEKKREVEERALLKYLKDKYERC